MSITTNIGLFKHDNPATNTDEFNVDKALNQNWDKLDTAIGKDRERITTLETDNTTNKTDISNIKSKDTDQDKYISELEAENTRLREDLNGLPQRQASGETIDLSDSAEMRCELKISGNSKQETRSGKNKFKLPESATINGINYTNNGDGTFNLVGTATNNAIFYIYLDTISAGIINGENYTLSSNNKFSSNVYCGVEDYNDTAWLSNVILLNEGNKKTQVLSITGNKLRFSVRVLSGETVNLTNVKVQLEKGLATEFEQYGASPSPDYRSEVKCCGDNGSINEVICNKNFFESPLIGYALVGSNSEGFNVSKNSNGVTYIAKLKNNQNYYIKKNNNIGDRFRIVLFNDYPVSTTYLKDSIEIISNANLYEYGFNSDKYNYVAFTVNASSIYSGDCLAQLELGSIATTYQEHKSQTYTIPTQQLFRSVGNTRDTFIKKNNKWYERHNINRRIFDGTINKFLRKSGTTNNLFVTNTFDDGNIIVPKTYGENVQHFNNYFQIKYSSDEMYIDGKYIGSAIRPTDDIAMGFGKESEINTVDKANAWLKTKYDAGAPLYVDYPLETPLDIECTEEQNTILDKIEKEAKTYKNVTHIYSTDEISPVIDVTYKKDLDTYIDNKINAVENAVIELGGNINV